MRYAYIMSGISGAGKTTLASKLASVVVEADHYMVNQAGEYDFKVERLKEAHAKCFRAFVEALGLGVCVAVANTNLSAEEIAPYFLAAQAWGYEPKIVVVRAPVEVANARNLHGVPMEKSKLQEERLNAFIGNLPWHWKGSVVDARNLVLK